MHLVSKHIKSLLFSNDCVVIPDFGGLVSNPHSASFNELNNRFSPPYKALGFNARLKKNDGLLTHEISIQENIDYSEAVEVVKQFVVSISETLESSGAFELAEIGTFYHDVNKSLRFKQNTKLPLDTNFFGLASFHAKPIEVASTQAPSSKPQPVVTPVLQEKKPTPIVNLSQSLHQDNPAFPWKKLAIAACILPFLFYVFWLGTYSNILGDTDQFQYSDLNPFVEKVCVTFDPRNEEASLFTKPVETISTLELIAEIGNDNFVKHSFLEESAIELHSKKELVVQVKEFTAAPFSTNVSFDKNLFAPRNQSGFYVITGCFGLYENATKYVSTLRNKGLSATIVDQKNGLFRVSANTSKTRSLALQKLRKLKSSGYPDAWVLSK